MKDNNKSGWLEDFFLKITIIITSPILQQFYTINTNPCCNVESKTYYICAVFRVCIHLKIYQSQLPARVLEEDDRFFKDSATDLWSGRCLCVIGQQLGSHQMTPGDNLALPCSDMILTHSYPAVILLIG